ncbi:MAG: DNA repair protein RadA [Elusimicrobia bacterium CG08_land_8_20_14_0_20_44_26]|nr:MAG: DNA repair protein RadA [Elusimicrobia bacterium CG08_land_8_20_14_0_20_44_26]
MFVCKECGYKSIQKFGQCPYCAGWNTSVEEKSEALANSRKAERISDIKCGSGKRITSGIANVDAVLGGGIVEGSIVLIAGAPGIGKSTLLLQAASGMEKVLYVSGEESPGQICMRSERIKSDSEDACAFAGRVQLLAAQNFDEVACEIERLKPDVVIIDSIQSIRSRPGQGLAASVGEMKEVAVRIVEIAKNSNISFILSGHITKEGILQGPKVIEHMVDVVMYMEESSDHAHRILYSTKNRFGNTREFALFCMTVGGLEVVPDASKYFLSGRCDIPGSVVVSACGGSTVFLAEVQALINTTSFQYPRRQVTGLELNRVYLVIAILERFTDIKLSSCDVYMNVAGGIKINEPAADLATAAAIASASTKRKVGKDTAFAGEIGLGGEIRNVSRLGERIDKAASFGFGKIIVPASGAARKNKIKVIEVKNIREALSAALVAPSQSPL